MLNYNIGTHCLSALSCEKKHFVFQGSSFSISARVAHMSMRLWIVFTLLAQAFLDVCVGRRVVKSLSVNPDKNIIPNFPLCETLMQFLISVTVAHFWPLYLTYELNLFRLFTRVLSLCRFFRSGLLLLSRCLFLGVFAVAFCFCQHFCAWIFWKENAQLFLALLVERQFWNKFVATVRNQVFKVSIVFQCLYFGRNVQRIPFHYYKFCTHTHSHTHNATHMHSNCACWTRFMLD